MRSICIGILGLGNVGAGALKILQDNRQGIERRLAASVRVKRVLVRDPARGREIPADPGLLTTNVDDVLGDPDIRIVVELMGGLEPARTYVMRALAAGKHVVTANKALLAHHGHEIFSEANRRRLAVYFEGSVAGGIPVIRALREGLASDRIVRITSIVNGTSNYILDAMTRSDLGFEQALAQAQAAGFAETDSTLDVDGTDAAHKLALLCLVSFGLRVPWEEIVTEGITRVRPFDVRMARELGYVIKSLAIAELVHDGPSLRVHPTLVPRDHVLAGVHSAYNAVLVESEALGRSLYYGPGAGMMPTGMAVVSDIIEAARRIITFADSGPPPEAFLSISPARAASLDDVESENYLCAHVPNVPGVLGRVASCLGRHGVSIKRMNQDTPGYGEPIDMVILTEATTEARLRAAITEIDTFEDVIGSTQRIRILEPEPVT